MPLLKTSDRRALESTGCEIRSDALTRALYATDASIHRLEPAAVAFPRSRTEAIELMRIGGESGISISPRGAGTGLVGACLGEGLVIDCSRHLRMIGELDRESDTVLVGPGVVLDRLNAVLAGDGLRFGPDVATSSRATLGGMIANDSSGAQAPVYGRTADHVVALEIVLPGGGSGWVGKNHRGFESVRGAAAALVERRRELIERRLPLNLVKRRPGYALASFAEDPSDLARLLCGSEGTLALIVSAILRVVPRPQERGLAVLKFASCEEAMEAAAALIPLAPAAIEHLDRMVFDRTRGRRVFAEARQLLGLEDSSCESLLLVEFFGRIEDYAGKLKASAPGAGLILCRKARERELVWELRRSGLSLVTGCVGPAKPATVIEDICVRPEQLPAYVRGLKEILRSRGLSASFYGHAASGLLHVRPTLDLHEIEDLRMLREIAEEASVLVSSFGGSIAGEHGVGISRTEFLKEHLGEEIIELSSRIKTLFDPGGLMNPGKIVDTGRFRLDADLRLGPGSQLRLPFEPLSAFVEKDREFIGNLEQCNGCGGCRKETPVMCPTFEASGEELYSTRGRANILSAILRGRLDGGIESEELGEALSSCLSCKACKRECPSGVDLALLKAETLQARHDRKGASLADEMISRADLLGRLGSATAPLSNWMLRFRPLRLLMEKILGLDASRRLPPFSRDRFDRWFEREGGKGNPPGGREILLWDDTWVRYHEPEIGRAAVRVLQRLGFVVHLTKGRRSCGRPAMSRGLMRRAREMAQHNVSLLRGMEEMPILFLEPSCWSAFVDEYRQFEIEGAGELAARCFLFENFIRRNAQAPIGRLEDTIAVHGHCHAKALGDRPDLEGVFSLVEDLELRWLDSGCCGMAGAYGLMKEHRELSDQVASPLLQMVDDLPRDARVLAAGTSCRHQIRELSGRRVLHPAELLLEAMENLSC